MSEPWFSMVLSGEKKEEYREIKTFYEQRLVSVYDNCSINKKSARYPDLYMSIFNEFDFVKFTNGYGNNRPSYLAEFKGIEARTGIEESGADPDKKYFVIKLGEISERFKC